MLSSMRAIYFFTLMLACVLATAQTCSPARKAAAARKLHTAQGAAIAFEVAPMVSGVSTEAAPRLTALKDALAEATDAYLACVDPSQPTTGLQAGLNAYLSKAAPGFHPPKAAAAGNKGDGKREDVDDDFKPTKGVLGDDVKASVSLVRPQLLQVETESSVPCGADSQLLVYAREGDHWNRALRWSSDFGQGNGSANSYAASSGGAWGDFFLTGIIASDASHPDDWRIVVAHGTPWCTSRFSGFGIAVLAPSQQGAAKVVWQTERGYSRLHFEPRFKVTSDSFELRLNEDAQHFDLQNGFERRVIYRYRVTRNAVSRIGPIATNALGFVEEWLDGPWNESALFGDPSATPRLKAAHDRYTENQNSKEPWTYSYGPVWACKDSPKHFQVELDVDNPHVGKGAQYYQLQENGEGYTMLVADSPRPDMRYAGPNLMKKR